VRALFSGPGAIGVAAGYSLDRPSVAFDSVCAKPRDHALHDRSVFLVRSLQTIAFGELGYKGVLCNLLVCLAVWLALAGRSVTDKVVAVVFPTSAFVAAGFEHCIANMYLIALAMLLRGQASQVDSNQAASLDWAGLAHNLIPVTLGNIVGGGIMVAAVYHLIYHRALANKSNNSGQPSSDERS